MHTKITERNLDRLKLPPNKPQLVVWDEDLPGFGVVLGRTATSFVVNYRHDGQLRRQVIGRRGDVREEWGNHPLNAAIARRVAREKLGMAAVGDDPAPADRNDGPTLREALDFHIEKMERGENRRGKVCSPRSIKTLRGAVELHLKEWLERPLVKLTSDVLDDVRKEIEQTTERRADTNPANPPGRAVANRLLANVSAVWRSWARRHGLPVANPTERLTPAALKPRENRIANTDLPSWHAKVLTIENPVRRDLQLVALFTGVRTDGVRNLRWDDVDFDEDLIHITRAKGDRPYTIPMVATVRGILDKRRTANAEAFKVYGGDQGYVFPSLDRHMKNVIPVAEVKERRVKRDAQGRATKDDDGNPIRETFLPGIQACRKTFNSVAIEVGIGKEQREALMNHEGKGVNVRSYGFPQDWDFLRTCSERVETALWERIKGNRPARRRGKLHAVA